MDLERLDPRYFTDQVCIIDFGESYDLSNLPTHLGIPSDYCSPELIFNTSIQVGTNIWALASTIFEIRCLVKLFDSPDNN